MISKFADIKISEVNKEIYSDNDMLGSKKTPEEYFIFLSII